MTDRVPTPPETREIHERVAFLSRMLDTAVRVPGTDVRFGLDALIGFVPVIGHPIAKAMGAYIIVEARRAGVPATGIARMIGNLVLDAGVGIIPVVGNIADVFWRANRKNLKILEEHLARDGYRAPRREPETIDGTVLRAS